jgi:hypothetical protein
MRLILNRKLGYTSAAGWLISNIRLYLTGFQNVEIDPKQEKKHAKMSARGDMSFINLPYPHQA